MRPVPVLALVLIALAGAFAGVPSVALAAAGPSVFHGAVACTMRPPGDDTEGQRWCEGDGLPGNVSTVSSFDGTPIDVTAAFPPKPEGGADGHFPVIATFHGWGGSKVLASDRTLAQRWLQQGYAVVSITDRGFGASCGPATVVRMACGAGYVHLMSNAYEVRDAQQVLGMLADEGVIDPGRIGVYGGSYGGAMAMQLATLNTRVQRPDGTLVPWVSPGGIPMGIAAAAPEITWSDIAAALQPNGSTLDYAAENPYAGPLGDRRFGIQKASWADGVYASGTRDASIAPVTGAGFPDRSADLTGWIRANDTGGPYDGEPGVLAQLAEYPNHGALGIDASVAPAPMLIANGWNDDLFPVSEAVRMYDRIRDLHPTTPVSLFPLNFGHPPRGGDAPAADIQALFAAEYAWFARYVKRTGAPIADAVGGVTALTSACGADGRPAPGAVYRGASWAALSPGEVRVWTGGSQAIRPATAPSLDLASPGDTVCTQGPATDTPGAAVATTPPAPAGGYTILGAPTVVADLTVRGAVDEVLARLYDVDPAAGTERLIARGAYRPTGVGATSRQVFGLSPQGWTVAASHVVKLELLSADAPFLRSAPGQSTVGVANLELRLPTADAPGAAGGFVVRPAPRVLPPGYRLARDLAAAGAPTTTLAGSAAPTPPDAGSDPPTPTPAPTPTPVSTPTPTPVPGTAGPGGGTVAPTPTPTPATKPAPTQAPTWGSGAPPTPTPTKPKATTGGATPDDAPTPGTTAPGDAEALAEARAALTRLPADRRLSKGGTAFSFADRPAGPGTLAYVLSIDIARAGEIHRFVLGTATVVARRAGARSVRVTIRADRAAVLRRHPRNRLILRTTLTTTAWDDGLHTTRRFAAGR